MRQKNQIFFLLFFGLFFCGNAVYAASGYPFKLKDVKLITKKRGVYFNYERGLYDVGGVGMEFQRKKLAIKHTNNHAYGFGFNYNVKYNILGYEAHYWHLKGVYGLTYGGDVFFFTNFSNSDGGIAPTVGFRFSGFHLQTGYKFLINGGEKMEVNRFFLRLRFTLNKKTDRDLRW